MEATLILILICLAISALGEWNVQKHRHHHRRRSGDRP